MASVPRNKTLALKGPAECMITEFTCELNTFLGSGTQYKTWKICLGGVGDKGAKSMEVHLAVDKAVVAKQKVRLSDKNFEGQEERVIWPQTPKFQKNGQALDRNFVYDWKFKGSVRMGMMKPPVAHLYEIRQIDTEETWWPGAITEEDQSTGHHRQ